MLDEGGLAVIICVILSDLVVMMYFGHKSYSGARWEH